MTVDQDQDKAAKTNVMERVTRDTLLPISMILVIIGAVWFLATDRQQAIGMLSNHERRIEATEAKMDSLLDGLHRIELRLGTLPVQP